MSSIGPELPPHLLAKRKRLAEEEESSKASPARPSSPSGSEKRRKVVGPAPPPAPLNELPPQPADSEDEESSSSDDDFGPAPPTGDNTSAYDDEMPRGYDNSAQPPPLEKKPQRDEWMMVPPKQDDLAARMDPTKLRARKFNSGKGARAPNSSGADNAIWTETPEQKRKRLENEVLGISAPPGAAEVVIDREQEATAKRIREHNEKSRGKSLYELHKSQTPKEKEDDPSKRAFDWEKDVGGGMKIGHAQRKELLNKAADFGSRFSGGKYL
ncbi:hypothetical protein AOQ84DRAFT_279548 [Glonium stellatum]|uniref:DUF3752 domain-containing protein n=1 Tax=Glonium stellatum TaxID=574774 RepID=A0A8E2FEN3_9PEZI|nr:hypothetical protein AOQ84DRAFT_279548 [Glonium stellatum]